MLQVPCGPSLPSLPPGLSHVAPGSVDQHAARVLEACSTYHRGLLQAALPAYALPSSLSMQQASEMMASGLDSSHALQQSAWAPATLAARQHAVKQLAEWLAQLPADWGLSLENISPELLGAYVTQQWLPRHAGTVVADGSKIAAPSSLSAMLSHLSTHFKQMGRLGQNGLISAKHGNPVESSSAIPGSQAVGRTTLCLGNFSHGRVHIGPSMLLHDSLLYLTISASPAQHEPMRVLIPPHTDHPAASAVNVYISQHDVCELSGQV